LLGLVDKILNVIVTFTVESYFLLLFILTAIPYSLSTFFFLIDLGFRVYLLIWSYHDLLIDISEVYAMFILTFLLLNSIIAPSILIQYTNPTQNLNTKKQKNSYLKSSSLFITYTWSTRFIASLSKIK
jgi:hypothetical protein